MFVLRYWRPVMIIHDDFRAVTNRRCRLERCVARVSCDAGLEPFQFARFMSSQHEQPPARALGLAGLPVYVRYADMCHFVTTT
jgi:hypothetical protein